MEYNPKDIDVIHLLKKLKDSSGVYPQEMLVSRRQGYLKQVAEIGGAAGLALGLKDTLKGGGGASSAPAAGTLVETLLLVAIIAEAGAVAYFYRDKVSDFFQSTSNTPRVEMVTEAPAASSPLPALDFTSTPLIAVTGTITETATPTATPTVVFAAEATQQENREDSAGTTNPSLSTPNPGTNNTNTNTNNGNQYGLTPKPERTREPGNNVSENNNDNNNNNQNDEQPSNPGRGKNR
jgi:hypothetical protein